MRAPARFSGGCFPVQAKFSGKAPAGAGRKRSQNRGARFRPAAGRRRGWSLAGGPAAPTHDLVRLLRWAGQSLAPFCHAPGADRTAGFTCQRAVPAGAEGVAPAGTRRRRAREEEPFEADENHKGGFSDGDRIAERQAARDFQTGIDFLCGESAQAAPTLDPPTDKPNARNPRTEFARLENLEPRAIKLYRRSGARCVPSP